LFQHFFVGVAKIPFTGLYFKLKGSFLQNFIQIGGNRFSEVYPHIDLLVNIDGLPLVKSSHTALWPILCSNTKDNALYILLGHILDIRNQKILIFIYL